MQRTQDREGIRNVDQAYFFHLQKDITGCKNALPHYVSMHENRMTEEDKPFNGRLIAAGVKPRFITAAQEAHLRERTELFFSVLPRVRDVLRDSKEVQRYFHLTKDEVTLLRTDHGYPTPVPFARFDGGFTTSGFRIYEVNMNCAATPGWMEMVHEVLSEFPFWKEFQKTYQVQYHVGWLERVYRGVMENYRAWGGRQSHPHILLLRWPGQYNQDTDRLCLSFQKQGHHSVVGDATQVHYTNGKVWYQGTQFDLVVRWFDLDHLFQDVGDIYRDILRAFYDNAACIVNPFSSSVLAHKSLFAFFTDERFSEYFSETERSILIAMCPWTRIIESRRTVLMDGGSGSLPEYIIREKDRLVIKQSIGTYGRNIHIGRTTTAQAWKKIIKMALKEGGWIVQEYITLPREKEPYVNKKGRVSERVVNQDIGPYMINGTYAGCMARSSYALVTNLMQNGCFQMVGTVKKMPA